MAAFTTAEKPNIKYHCELNPVKFRPLEQHWEIHICGHTYTDGWEPDLSQEKKMFRLKLLKNSMTN
jgi:hypothetical protein